MDHRNIFFQESITRVIVFMKRRYSNSKREIISKKFLSLYLQYYGLNCVLSKGYIAIQNPSTYICDLICIQVLPDVIRLRSGDAIVERKKEKSLSHVWLFAIPWTVACQAPLSRGFSRQETGVGCHVLLQGIFPTQVSHTAGRYFTVWATREAQGCCRRLGL